MIKDDLREAVDFGIALASFGAAVLEDGKVNAGDLGTFLSHAPGLITKGIAAAEGLDNIKIADVLSDAERRELVSYVKAQLDLVDDVTEDRIEKFVEAVLSIIGFVASLKKQQ